MAKVHGKDADLWVNGQSMEDDGNRITLTISPETVDLTSFGDNAKANKEGLYGWTLDYDGFWNAAANANDQIFFQMIGGGGKEIKFFPNGSAANRIYYWGTAILTSYRPEAGIGGGVTCAASLAGDGSLSRGTAS
ncbi:MAG: hypothetical protein ACFFD4_07530 [Candidatus Odinarchaeota archaeon]